jgi:hypothetical protein
VSRTLAFESRLLMLEVFEVDVMEVLRWFTLHSIIDRPETSKENKTNKTEHQLVDNQQYDVMAR